MLNPANYSSAPGFLPRVTYSQYNSGTAPLVQLQGSIFFSDTTYLNTLSAGEVYGDTSNETGLFLAHQVPNGLTPNLGTSGYTNRRFGSPKYKVQAVPEPATLTVALAGLALMRARRKRTVTI
jgi:uncharacterized protein (TIGR03382 family)